MKSYTELDEGQQKRAVERCLRNLLDDVLAGLRFSDELNRNDVQARIDKAIGEAESMRTPWFAGEYVMDAVGEELESIARAEAENALYSETSDYVIAGVI